MSCWLFTGLIFWAACILWLLISCQMYSWQSVGCLCSLFALLCRSFSLMQSHLSIFSLNC
jgi:hypothetical protein